jgi:hypothetical protein
MNNLNEHMATTWQQLKEAVASESWATTQAVFRRMVTLQDLNEQARAIEERIAGLSIEAAATPAGPEKRQTSANLMSRLNGTRRETKRPKVLRIGADRLPIAMSNQIAIATANWILKQGVAIPQIRNFVHPTNSGFAPSAQIKVLDNGSYIEIGDHQEVLIQKARKLLNACGFRDRELEITLEDGTKKIG